MRTLLLGDIGNRLDIEDTERDISNIRLSQSKAAQALHVKEQELALLRVELGRHKLAIEALSRFLIHKDIISATELDDFIQQVDAEDGVLDGRLELDSARSQLRFQRKTIPEGTYRKPKTDPEKL